jgi:hypothetical protein
LLEDEDNVTDPLPVLPEPLNNVNEPPDEPLLSPPNTDTLPAVVLEAPEPTDTAPLLPEVAAPDFRLNEPELDDVADEDPLPTDTAPLEPPLEPTPPLDKSTRPLAVEPTPDTTNTHLNRLQQTPIRQ